MVAWWSAGPPAKADLHDSQRLHFHVEKSRKIKCLKTAQKYFVCVWFRFPALLNMFCHHSYSSSAMEPSSSSMPQCGAHSSSGVKAICSGLNLFFLQMMVNNNNNNK